MFNLTIQLKQKPLHTISVFTVAYEAVRSTFANGSQGSAKSCIACLAQRLKVAVPEAKVYLSGPESYQATLDFLGLRFMGSTRTDRTTACSAVFTLAWNKLSEMVDDWTDYFEGNSEDVLPDVVHEEVVDRSRSGPFGNVTQFEQMAINNMLAMMRNRSVFDPLGSWVRDLTEEGIEPNPGPPKKGQMRRKPKVAKRKKAPKTQKRVAKTKKQRGPRQNAAVRAAMVRTMTPNSIVLDHNLDPFGSLTNWLLEEMVNNFVAAAFAAYPPKPSDFTRSGTPGPLCPVFIKTYLMQAVMTALREEGCLYVESGDVFELFPNFPESNVVPTALLAFLQYFMPYEHGSGDLKVSFAHNFRVLATYFDTTYPALRSSHSGVAYGRNPVYALETRGVAPYQEFSHVFGLNTDVSPKTIFGSSSNYRDQIATYLSGIFPCVPFSRRKHRAPDASSYVDAYISVEGGAGYVCAIDHFTPMISEMCIVPAGAVSSNWSLFKRGGGFMREFTTFSDAFWFNASLNYALCAVDFHVLTSIPQMVSKSKWRGIDTFIPNIVRYCSTGFQTILWTVCDKLGLSNEASTVLETVAYSKLIYCMRNGVQFLGTRPIFDPFGDEPLPAPIAAYLMSVGPVVACGRIQYNVPTTLSNGNVTAGSQNWLSRVVNGFTAVVGTDSHSIWGNNISTPGGLTISGLSFAPANWPSATYNVDPYMVVVPVKTAPNFTLTYQRIAAYNNFVPFEQSNMGGVENLYMIESVPSTWPDGGSKVASGAPAMTLGVTISIAAIYAYTLGSDADALRAATYCMRVETASAALNRCTAYNVQGINEVDVSRAFAEWLVAGPGWNYINQRIAEAQPHITERNMGRTIGGVTMPSTQSTAATSEVVKEATNDFTSNLSSKMKSVGLHHVKDVAKTIAGYDKGFTFSEFLPSALEAVSSIVSGTAKRVSEKKIEKDLAYYARHPDEAVAIGKKMLRVLNA